MDLVAALVAGIVVVVVVVVGVGWLVAAQRDGQLVRDVASQQAAARRSRRGSWLRHAAPSPRASRVSATSSIEPVISPTAADTPPRAAGLFAVHAMFTRSFTFTFTFTKNLVCLALIGCKPIHRPDPPGARRHGAEPGGEDRAIVVGVAGEVLGGGGVGVALRVEHAETDHTTLGAELGFGRGDVGQIGDDTKRHYLIALRGYGRYSPGDHDWTDLYGQGISAMRTGLVTATVHAGAGISYPNASFVPTLHAGLALAVPLAGNGAPYGGTFQHDTADLAHAHTDVFLYLDPGFVALVVVDDRHVRRRLRDAARRSDGRQPRDRARQRLQAIVGMINPTTTTTRATTERRASVRASPRRARSRSAPATTMRGRIANVSTSGLAARSSHPDRLLHAIVELEPALRHAAVRLAAPHRIDRARADRTAVEFERPCPPLDEALTASYSRHRVLAIVLVDTRPARRRMRMAEVS